MSHCRWDAGLNRRQETSIVNPQNQLAGIGTRGDIIRALQSNNSNEMIVGNLGCSSILSARIKIQEEETIRQKDGHSQCVINPKSA